MIRNIVLCAFLCLGSVLSAQQLPSEEGTYSGGEILNSEKWMKIGDFYGNHQVLKIDLESNFSRLYTHKDDHDPSYQNGMMGMWANDSVMVVKKVKVKVRGNTRLKICEIPPLRLDVKKTKFEPDWVKKLQNTKVVLPCREGSQYNQYLAKEYLAYRIYNVLTDHSFRVRRADFRLFDTKERKNGDYQGFFVEADKRVEKRLDIKEANEDEYKSAMLSINLYLQPDSLSVRGFSTLALFQYMIGNTDWSANRYHNIKIFTEGDKLLAFPYDFDYSGLVNAEYALASTSLPITKVTDRYYLGPCVSAELFDEVVALFQANREEILALISNDSHLSKRSKTSVNNYIESFYKEIMVSEAREKIRKTNCRYLSN